MATALDLISRSLRILGVYAIGEAPSQDESASGLVALNALMESLSNTPLIYAPVLDVVPLAAGVASITVGPSGTTVAGRPLEVLDDSYIQNGSVTYPLDVFTQQQYSDIIVKSTQGLPQAVWPLMNVPNVQLTFWPVPIGGLTLYLWSTKALQTFPALTTVVTLPAGYEDLIAYELAEALAPEFSAELPASAQRRLQRLRRTMSLANLEVPMLKQRSGIVQQRYNVLTNR